jgi:hypothetical protein
MAIGKLPIFYFFDGNSSSNGCTVSERKKEAQKCERSVNNMALPFSFLDILLPLCYFRIAAEHAAADPF